MKSILDRWYFTLIVIPIILTYLTSFFSLPKLYSDWKLSIIFSLSISILILLHEVIIMRKKIRLRESSLSESDKNTIRKLFKKLDLKMFQEDICEKDSKNGYKSEAIHKIISYRHSASLIKNHPKDEKLNLLLQNFNSSLDVFIEFSSSHLFGGNCGFLVLNKEYLNRNQLNKNAETMNELSQITYNELIKIIDYLKKMNYQFN